MAAVHVPAAVVGTTGSICWDSLLMRRHLASVSRLLQPDWPHVMQRKRLDSFNVARKLQKPVHFMLRTFCFLHLLGEQVAPKLLSVSHGGSVQTFLFWLVTNVVTLEPKQDIPCKEMLQSIDSWLMNQYMFQTVTERNAGCIFRNIGQFLQPTSC